MVDSKAVSDVIDNLDVANLDCLLKRLPGEPMFIILGRDPDGGFITRLWAQRRFDAGDTEHANSVFSIADEMDAWASTHKPESAPLREAYDKLPADSNNLPANLFDETLKLLKNSPRHITFVEMARHTECSVSWISRLAAGKIAEPNVHIVQKLYNYLKGINHEI